MNVLLITTDEHHWRCMGNSAPLLITLNLDRLAEQGTIFDRAYCTNPTFTPSRVPLPCELL